MHYNTESTQGNAFGYITGSSEYSPIDNFYNTVFGTYHFLGIPEFRTDAVYEALKKVLKPKDLDIIQRAYGIKCQKVAISQLAEEQGVKQREMTDIISQIIDDNRPELKKVLDGYAVVESGASIKEKRERVYSLTELDLSLSERNAHLASQNKELIKDIQKSREQERIAESRAATLTAKFHNNNVVLQRFSDEKHELLKTVDEIKAQLAEAEAERQKLLERAEAAEAEIEVAKKRAYKEGRADGLRTAATEAFSNGYENGYKKGLEEGRAQVGKDFQDTMESAKAEIGPIAKSAEERRKKYLIEDIIPDERIVRKLHRRGIYTAIDLSNLTEEELHDDFRLGYNDIFVIKVSLKQRGFTLKTAD